MLMRRTQQGDGQPMYVDPDVQAAQDSLNQQQAMAQNMQQQAMQQQPAQNMQSPWALLAQGAQGAAAGYMNQQNQGAQMGLNRDKMYAMAQMLQGGFNTGQLPDAPRE